MLVLRWSGKGAPRKANDETGTTKSERELRTTCKGWTAEELRINCGKTLWCVQSHSRMSASLCAFFKKKKGASYFAEHSCTYSDHPQLIRSSSAVHPVQAVRSSQFAVPVPVPVRSCRRGSSTKRKVPPLILNGGTFASQRQCATPCLLCLHPHAEHRCHPYPWPLKRYGKHHGMRRPHD